MRIAIILSCGALLFAGCGGDDDDTTITPPPVDTTAPDTTVADTGVPDTTVEDAGAEDTATTDATVTDSGEGEDTATPPKADFACLGKDPAWPKAEGTEMIEFEGQFLRFTSKAPMAGVALKYCAHDDFECLAPTMTATTDDKGKFTVKLPKGWWGHIEAQGGDAYPTLIFLDAPVTKKPDVEPEVATLLAGGEVAVLAQLVGVTPDPARGQVAVNVFDCAGNRASDVAVDFGGADDKTVVAYFANGVPSATAKATDHEGLVGIINAEPGWHTSTGTGPEGAFGRASGYVRAGWVTITLMEPAQTTPDLSCGEYASKDGWEGEATGTMVAADYLTKAPITGMHVKGCDKADLECKTPLFEGDTDATGAVTVKFTATAAGFGGYIEATGGGVAPTLLYFNPPLKVTSATPPPMNQPFMTSATLSGFAQMFGVTLDPEAGHVAAAAKDCRLWGAHGLTVTSSASGAGTKTIYAKDGIPDAAATATDDTGAAGLFNLPPGEVTFTATNAGGAVGKVTINVRKGFLHQVGIAPSK